MLTTIVVICGIWVIGCVALVYMILRAGALADDEARPASSSTDPAPPAPEVRSPATSDRPADSKNPTDSKEDACASV